MGIMTAWKKWSQAQYNIWGSKLQEKYDFWTDYDNPELRSACQGIWAILPTGVQKKIYDMLIGILKQYGPDLAKEIVKKLSEAFTTDDRFKNT